MGDYGLGVTWGEFKPGRERKAFDLWAEALAFNEKLVADNKIERWDAVLFEPSGAYPLGAVRFYGTAEQIEALASSEEFTSIVYRGEFLLNGFGFRRFITGQALLDAVGRSAVLIDSL
jgi:hypothetical protein